MNNLSRFFSHTAHALLLAVLAIALTAVPSQSFASHPAGGDCKHDGGLYSICKAKEVGKKCKRGGQTGRCSQHAKGCTCDLSSAAVLENAVTDLRESFDVILASGELLASQGQPLPPDLNLGCAQVQTIVQHLHNAMPVILPTVAEPSFVSTGLLADVDRLIRDLQEAAAIVGGCEAALPPELPPALFDLKANYLSTFSELLED